MVQVTVGIPTYNGAHRVEQLLQSIWMRTPELDKLAGGGIQIVLVDDGSPRVEETRRVANAWGARMPLHYVEHGQNRGISAAWNTAARAFDARIVVLCNDDVIVSSDWLESLVHALDHSPGIGCVGQSWHGFKDEDVPGLLAGPFSDREVTPRDPLGNPSPERRTMFEDCNPGRVPCVTGQLFALRRADFDAIGGFDERMKSFFEESTMGFEMARKLGKIGMQLNWPFCFHRWSQTFKDNPELDAGGRMEHSRNVFRERFGVPGHVPRGQEFTWANPTLINHIGDVDVEFLRKGRRIEKGTLRADGAYVARQPEAA